MIFNKIIIITFKHKILMIITKIMIIINIRIIIMDMINSNIMIRLNTQMITNTLIKTIKIMITNNNIIRMVNMINLIITIKTIKTIIIKRIPIIIKIRNPIQKKHIRKEICLWLNHHKINRIQTKMMKATNKIYLTEIIY